jgi:hypothetical protein
MVIFQGWIMPTPVDGYRSFNIKCDDGGSTINATKIVDWTKPGEYYF